MQGYEIRRMYPHAPYRVITHYDTLKEAQKHCRNPETSSQTCSPETAKACPGLWFDGYTELGRKRSEPNFFANPTSIVDALQRISMGK